MKYYIFKHEYFFKNLIYICLVPHSIWDTLISHVRSVEVPENVNARDAVTPEAGPTLRYTKDEEEKYYSKSLIIGMTIIPEKVPGNR